MDEIDRMAYGAPRRGLGWLFPTALARARAARLQGLVQEREYDSNTAVDDDRVGIATIHSRQDIVLLVSWQEAHHRQLVNISRGVWVVGILILSAVSQILDHLPA